MKNTFLACLSILTLSSACGDDKELFEIDSNKKLSELNDAEARTLCDYQEFLVNEVDRHKVQCFAEAEPNTCDVDAKACVENEEIEFINCAELTFAESTYASCSSVPTVAEMQRCLEVSADFFSNLADKVTCSNIFAETQDLPDECQTIDVECPRFFGTEDNENQSIASTYGLHSHRKWQLQFK